MNKMKIVADDKIPFLRGVLEPFSDILYKPGSLITASDIKDADALLVRTRTKCSGELLKGSGVSFIGTATIGFDHIDTAYCEKKGIQWTNAPGCNSSSVQQYIAAALLEIAGHLNFSLKGRTIGIVGVGNVGSKVEKFARLTGMNVLLNDPPRARREGAGIFTGLDTVLRESDIITVHVPLNTGGEDRTYHLFNSAVFKQMKRGAWFINSSRGEVADSGALLESLSRGALGGAVLDVWENEPLIDIDLLDKAFIATPHVAGYSIDGKANGTAMIVNALCKHFDLPLRNWYPAGLPEPAKPVLTINCKGTDVEEVTRRAVKHTYDIRADDKNLRFDPSGFEKQRGDYGSRREFRAYKINLPGCLPGSRSVLEQIGFAVSEG